MKTTISNSLKLIALGAALVLSLAAASTGDPAKDPLSVPCDPPKVKATRNFRYKFFPGFVEFRTNDFAINQAIGEVVLLRSEKTALINIDIIAKVIEWGGKKHGYTTLVYTKGKEGPILVLQSYKEVMGAIRKASEGKVG